MIDKTGLRRVVGRLKQNLCQADIADPPFKYKAEEMDMFGEKIKQRWLNACHLASGFSLIEIIVAMVILGALMLSFALMFSRGKAFIRGQAERRVAINLAQEGLEIVNSMAFTTVENNLLGTATESPPLNFVGDSMNGSGGRPDFSDYQRDTFISYIKDDPVTTTVVDLLEDCNIDTPDFEDCNYLRVQVTVTNTKTAAEVGSVAEVSLETVISRWR